MCALFDVAAVAVVSVVAVVTFTLDIGIAMLLIFVKFGVPLWPSS